jgi:hypothetical protein
MNAQVSLSSHSKILTDVLVSGEENLDVVHFMKKTYSRNTKDEVILAFALYHVTKYKKTYSLKHR